MSFFGTQMQRDTSGKIPGTIDPSSQAPTPLGARSIEFTQEIIGDIDIISHDHGLFTIHVAGTFYVSWFITLKTGLGEMGHNFALHTENLTTHATKDYPSTNSMKTGQLSGSAILQVGDGQKCTLGLYNMGEYEATLATNTAVTANIVIHPYQVEPYTTSYGLIGATLTLTNAAASTLAPKAPVLFNTSTTTTADVFEYDTTTHLLTILRAGNYLFNWSVNVEGSQNASAISFGIKSGDVTLSTFDSTLILQHPYSGFAFVTVSTPPTSFQLINTSVDATTAGSPGAALTFSTTPVQATMLIMGHS